MTPPTSKPAGSHVTVRVPGSTSNLGPGFDQLGLALDLPLVVRVERTHRAQHEVVVDPACAQNWPRQDSRMLRAFDEVWRRHAPMVQAHPCLRFHVQSEIPLCRGLGSSGAATAAGLLLAAELLGQSDFGGQRPELGELERIGVAIEGHPDNVIASLYGGCTLGVVLEDGSLRVVQPAVHRSLLFPVAWPSTELSTDVARAAMPKKLGLGDVVWTLRRFSLLLEGLRTGAPDLLHHGVEDRLHTPYRLPLIDGAQAALGAARDAGAFCAAISGSGSALIAMHNEAGQAQIIAEAMEAELSKRHPSAQSRVLRTDFTGAKRLD